MMGIWANNELAADAEKLVRLTHRVRCYVILEKESKEF